MPHTNLWGESTVGRPLHLLWVADTTLVVVRGLGIQRRDRVEGATKADLLDHQQDIERDV